MNQIDVSDIPTYVEFGDTGYFFIKEENGFLLIGPFEFFGNIISKRKFSNKIGTLLKPLKISISSLCNPILTINMIANGQTVTREEFMEHNFNYINDDVTSDVIKQFFISEVDSNNHHGYDQVERIETAISNADKDALSEGLDEIMSNEQTVESVDSFRNIKNMTICGITIITRAAIKSGANYRTAYALSDKAIQAVEQTKNPKEPNLQIRKLAYALCDMVQAVKEDVSEIKNYNIHVLKAKKYIKEHLTGNTNVETIADNLFVTPNYLSSIFKKETGMTISQYVLKLKMSLAKKMLKYSNLTKNEIAFELGFSSQSHFCSAFKSITGLTPNEYIKSSLSK
ncbi:MAG: AraC family transcriptional regulator [Bacilli bacterium]|nr:AraC family transcriptional regulator [Bacilli bacterium]